MPNRIAAWCDLHPWRLPVGMQLVSTGVDVRIHKINRWGEWQQMSRLRGVDPTGPVDSTACLGLRWHSEYSGADSGISGKPIADYDFASCSELAGLAKVLSFLARMLIAGLAAEPGSWHIMAMA